MEVVSVWIKIDSGEWKEATGTLSWFYIWDVTRETAGSHTITARAFDGKIYSDEVSVTVTVKSSNVNPGDMNGDLDDILVDEVEGIAWTLSLMTLLFLGGGLGIIITVVIIVMILVKRRSRYEAYYY